MIYLTLWIVQWNKVLYRQHELEISGDKYVVRANKFNGETEMMDPMTLDWLISNAIEKIELKKR